MMEETGLKQNFVRGMAWTIAEKVGTALFQFCVSIVCLNLIDPDSYGLIALLIGITTICSVFVDGGFSAAIIRKKEVAQKEFNAMFTFNIFSALMLYGILTACTPWIAVFYDSPQLLAVAPVLFLLVPVSSLINVQTAVYSRQMDFKSITRYTLWANFISSIVVIALALCGFGVWALVGQRLCVPVVRALLLWTKGTWRPSGLSLSPLKGMAGFSSSIFVGDLLNNVLGALPSFFIPKQYSDTQLGLYSQGQKIKDMPVAAVVSSVQSVTLPALSRLQDQPDKMSTGAHKVIAVMNFLVFPIMMGFIAVADDMFHVLINEKWWPSVVYFRIFCIMGFFAPLQVMAGNVMRIRCGGKTMLRYELVKKTLAAAVLLIAIPISVKAIVWGQVGIFVADTLINSVGAARHLRWPLSDRLAESLPYLAIALVMWAVVWGVGVMLTGVVALGWILVIKIVAGAAVYFALNAVFRPAAWKELRSIVK